MSRTVRPASSSCVRGFCVSPCSGSVVSWLCELNTTATISTSTAPHALVAVRQSSHFLQTPPPEQSLPTDVTAGAVTSYRRHRRSSHFPQTRPPEQSLPTDTASRAVTSNRRGRRSSHFQQTRPPEQSLPTDAVRRSSHFPQTRPPEQSLPTDAAAGAVTSYRSGHQSSHFPKTQPPEQLLSYRHLPSDAVAGAVTSYRRRRQVRENDQCTTLKETRRSLNAGWTEQ